MLLPLILFIGIIILGFFIYKLADYYAQKYLGFNPSEHLPIYTPGRADAPALVCVLGWGGSTRRQLRRLLEFYSSQGIPTVSWINPMLNYLFGVDDKQVERLLDLLIRENHNSNNIIVHLHSNNGTLVWSHMLNIMKANERYRPLLSNIKGIIFDSAPFRPPYDSYHWIFRKPFFWLFFSAAGSSRPCLGIILNRPQYVHIFWTPFVTYYLYLKSLYQHYFSSDPLSSDDKIGKCLNEIPINIKQYYLYSDGDYLIPRHVIEQVMTNQKNRGVQVNSHRFGKSTHVNHFRLFPEEYGKFVLDFISNIQNNQQSENVK